MCFFCVVHCVEVEKLQLQDNPKSNTKDFPFLLDFKTLFIIRIKRKLKIPGEKTMTKEGGQHHYSLID